MGFDPQVTVVAYGDLHVGALPPETRQALLACAGFGFLEPDWYLAGRTALALQVGHRSSEDLDFFTKRKKFDIESLEHALEQRGDWMTMARRP